MTQGMASQLNRRLRQASLVLLLAVLSLVNFGAPSSAVADPDYGDGPILYGLDPVIKTTDDPRLLGVARLVMRERLAALGIDPVRDAGRRPDLESSFYKVMLEKSRVDLVLIEHLVEYNGPLGLMTEFRYPSYFYLFPTAEPLPGGFTYFPPRPVTDPVVELFVDDLAAGAQRRHAVSQILVRTEILDVAGGGKNGGDNKGLINLTIPIKLPRTLEKIIGRGEKTRIKITGRERIAITGESTVVKPFVANERVSSQSLFPSLDMEQELQINLSGVIGEKIIIEVDHNSAQIGPDATNIKLMYQGTEDEVIKTIESGDVGLTLPGATLLGYNSSSSGLFGIKVTGQFGRADFTVVASKQKAESSSKVFNATGGQVTDHSVFSSNYINNRFFRLDLPGTAEPNGRRTGERIDLTSIKIFKFLGTGELRGDDISNVAVYIDSTGFRAWNDVDMDFQSPRDFGFRWHQITDFDFLTSLVGNQEVLEAIDMRSSLLSEDILAVVYDVVDANGTLIQHVGDDPSRVAATQILPTQSDPYYKMKMLKAPANRNHQHIFNYVLRNIYSLGGSNIDLATFNMRIEVNDQGVHSDFDENNIPYIRIFGLDSEDPGRNPGADGLVDFHDPLIFDMARGLLKFPLDFPEPFNATEAQYTANVGNDEDGFSFETSVFLANNLSPEIYDPDVLPTEYNNFERFKIIATHASASSTFNLNASQIEEGSEVVVLDGKTLTRGVDYEIDYTFGELQLKGDAANLTPDSKIGVTYSFSPFFGGGNKSLMGLNLGYDLGRNSKFGTTWLYETSAIVGEKAKLGEEPSKNLVGNFNLSHTFKPHFLTTMANMLSRHNTERESSVQLTGEVAMSLPNPNTKGQVFLEDFEGVDASDIISLSRLSWSWASAPFLDQKAALTDDREFKAADRVENVRWFLPQERALRRHLNPELVNQERDETQPTMDMYLRSDNPAGWQSNSWGGIMRGISRTGLDLSKSQFVEIWINDGATQEALRTGKVHLDFGYISEDGFWPTNAEGLVVGEHEKEDTNSDGVWIFDEDVGLDGRGETGPQRFIADFEVGGDEPYPFINGTARNNREDDEDLNANGRLDLDNGYFTTTIDLAETEAFVDVENDYTEGPALAAEGFAWRKYRVPIGAVGSVKGGITPSIKAITHVRIWYENEEPGAPQEVHLQFSEFRFLGSRWEREGVRRIDGEVLLTAGERFLGEEFFLGEVNNKENPDYRPPFTVEEINNIPEKEQSLVLNFQNIEQGHMVRASKQVSSQGDDYTRYRDLSWYWNNINHTNADLDLFFRIGADTLNYYEVNYRYADNESKVGWELITINIAELSNTKNGEPDILGHVHDTIRDVRNGVQYNVRVVGRPDLRRVKRYYFGLANNTMPIPASGTIYINDVKLEGVKRELGLAERAGVRLNMADVIKADFDWKKTDAEFHGLNKDAGSGVNFEEWSFNSSLNVDDFIPMLGFRLPIKVNRQQTLLRPKYITSSDIEILDEDVRNAESTVSTSEGFTSRLSHAPSKSGILRYLVDPWVLAVSGSRTRKDSPIDRVRDKKLAGSINYDLRINGIYNFGRYPVLKYIPVVSGLAFLPKKVAFGGNFSSSQSQNVSINEDGVETPRLSAKRRPANFNASVDYQPLSILDMTVNGRSERDLLRETEKYGVNIGEENSRGYDLRLTVSPPKARSLPTGKVFAPVRMLARGAIKLRPRIQFTGFFADDHRPGIREADDPDNIRSVSNQGKWDLQGDIPVGDIFKSIFPERKGSQSDRARLIAEQRALELRADRQRGRGGSGETTPPTEADEQADEFLTPEERLKREEERLAEAANERMEQERDDGLFQEAEKAPRDPDGRINPLVLVEPLLRTLRSTTPVKVTYTTTKGSSYIRLKETADFWYKTGLVNTLDVDEDQYTGFAFDERRNLTLSTTTKLAKSLALDVKYSTTRSIRDQLGTFTESYKQEWPDGQISLTGLEKWGVFGAKEGDRESGWFRSSNINFSYKRSKNVSGITETRYDPKVTTTMTPRWTINFHSGLTASVNATLSSDSRLSNGATTTTGRSRYAINVQHQFRADGVLSKLGLYRPGASQSISMNLDMSYQRDLIERLNPTGIATAPTGNVRYSANPRFSVQVTRSLNAAVRFIFSRSKNIANDQSTTSLGLGLEATFVF